MDIREPEIMREDLLILDDGHFNTNNVCIVTGAGTGIGRATAVAAAANSLMTVGLDINEEEGQKTERMAREMGGEMMPPIDVANLFIFGFSRFSRYLIGGDLLFDGGMVLTY